MTAKKTLPTTPLEAVQRADELQRAGRADEAVQPLAEVLLTTWAEAQSLRRELARWREIEPRFMSPEVLRIARALASATVTLTGAGSASVITLDRLLEVAEAGLGGTAPNAAISILRKAVASLAAERAQLQAAAAAPASISIPWPREAATRYLHPHNGQATCEQIEGALARLWDDFVRAEQRLQKLEKLHSEKHAAAVERLDRRRRETGR